ncbi:MAG: hypothetical protein K8F60_03800 [Melioribacteraceae bacterium]|nr:hypothetical protein [Melioribacteraceae bacterium]
MVKDNRLSEIIINLVDYYKANQSFYGFSNILTNDLANIVKGITYKKLGKSFNYNEAILKDIQAQTLQNILKGIKNGSEEEDAVWNKYNVIGDEADKVFYSYLSLMINTAKNEMAVKEDENESNKLYKAVDNVLKQLLESGRIFDFGNKIYQSYEGTRLDLFSITDDLDSEYINILSPEGRLDHSKIKSLVEQIISNKLENFSFNTSIITEIVKLKTFVGIQNAVPLEFKDNNNESNLSHEPHDEDNNLSKLFEQIEHFSPIWLDRLRNEYDEENIKLYGKFLFGKLVLKKTLAEIVIDNHKVLKKTAVDNKIKEFIRAINIFEEIEDNDPFALKYLELFCMELNEIYGFYDLSKESI